MFSDVANPYSVSVGASGAIYAITGRWAFYLTQNYKSFSKASYPFLVFFGVMLGFGLLNGFTSPGVDGWGHLGGIITGILLSGVLFPSNEQPNPLPKQYKIALTCGLVVYMTIFIICTFTHPLKNCDSYQCHRFCKFD